MIRVFKRVILKKNLVKTKAIICTPELIRGKHGSEAYTRRATGKGPTFQEMERTRVSCEVYGGTMVASSLRYHMEIAHGRLLPQASVSGVGVGLMEVYKVSFLRILKLVDCLVEGCPSKAKPR